MAPIRLRLCVLPERGAGKPANEGTPQVYLKLFFLNLLRLP
jgi:hypothetical protein